VRELLRDGIPEVFADVGFFESDVWDYSVFEDSGGYRAVGSDFDQSDPSDAGAVLAAAFSDAAVSDTLQVGPGTFDMPTAVTMEENMHVKGAGRRNTDIRFDSNPGHSPAFDFAGGNTSSEQTMEGFVFNETGGATVTVFNLGETTQTLKDMWFGSVDQAVVLDGAVGWDLIDLHSDGVTGFDIEVKGSTRNGYMRNVNTFDGKRGILFTDSGSGIPQEIVMVGCATEDHIEQGFHIAHGTAIASFGHLSRANDEVGMLFSNTASNIAVIGPVVVDNGADTGASDKNRSGIRLDSTRVVVSNPVFSNRSGTQQHHVFFDSNSVDCDVRAPIFRDAAGVSNVGVAAGATRPRWNGVIGGGPLDGVDLSSTTGQWVGDRAIADGTSTAEAGALARWDGSAWQFHDPTGTV
jgi:hypothetical protein